VVGRRLTFWSWLALTLLLASVVVNAYVWTSGDTTVSDAITYVLQLHPALALAGVLVWVALGLHWWLGRDDLRPPDDPAEED